MMTSEERVDWQNW